jgi:predicted transcriptional regulator of viral defense system
MVERHQLNQDGFTQAEAALVGIDSRTLYRWRDRGEVEQISRGLFRFATPKIVDLDLIEIAARLSRATLCLSTALARYGLVDEIPPSIDVAVPRGNWRPSLVAPASVHSFDVNSFDIGRSTTSIEGTDMTIGIYSPARSIVDAFRLRARVSYETPVEALRTWLAQPGNSPAELIEIAAQVPRAKSPVLTALRHLA